MFIGCHLMVKGCHLMIKGCHLMVKGCYLMVKGYQFMAEGLNSLPFEHLLSSQPISIQAVRINRDV